MLGTGLIFTRRKLVVDEAVHHEQRLKVFLSVGCLGTDIILIDVLDR